MSEDDPRQWYFEEQREIERLRQRGVQRTSLQSAGLPVWVLLLIGIAVALGAVGYWLVKAGVAEKAMQLLRILLR